MRAVGMESHEEGEIPLIQEAPLKKTKMLLWLAGGESDGRKLVCVSVREFYVSAKQQMLFPFSLAGCMLMGILGVGLWQAGGGLHAGSLEEMEVRRDAVSEWGKVSRLRMSSCEPEPSRDLRWWN